MTKTVFAVTEECTNLDGESWKILVDVYEREEDAKRVAEALEKEHEPLKYRVQAKIVK